MKRTKFDTSQIAFLAACIAMGLISKRIVSPLTNVLTDFIRLPGGGAAAGFAIMFLALGCSVTKYPLAGTISGLAQGILGLMMGMSAYQGIFAIITYTVPGMVIDIVRKLIKTRSDSYFIISCCLGNVAGAAISNLLTFHFTSFLLVMWLLVAACSGCLGGMLGGTVLRRMEAVSEFRRMRKCVRN